MWGLGVVCDFCIADGRAGGHTYSLVPPPPLPSAREERVGECVCAVCIVMPVSGYICEYM